MVGEGERCARGGALKYFENGGQATTMEIILLVVFALVMVIVKGGASPVQEVGKEGSTLVERMLGDGLVRGDDAVDFGVSAPSMPETAVYWWCCDAAG